jgi:histidinol-phosphate aminotransferase
MIAGYRAICDNDYYMDNAKKIVENREYTRAELQKLGFRVLDSKTNFLFCESSLIDGEALYLALKDHGILVRHFTLPRIKNFNRITIGTREEMETLISEIQKILKEKKI